MTLRDLRRLATYPFFRAVARRLDGGGVELLEEAEDTVSLRTRLRSVLA